MTKEELRLKVQALVDNELAEEEIAAVLKEIEGSYDLREEYVELLKLRRRIEKPEIAEPPKEWYEAVARKTGRRVGLTAGIFALVGSYVLLLIYALTSMFSSARVDLLIKILFGAMAAGLVILLFITIADRIRESRSDRYKEVIR